MFVGRRLTDVLVSAKLCFASGAFFMSDSEFNQYLFTFKNQLKHGTFYFLFRKAAKCAAGPVAFDGAISHL